MSISYDFTEMKDIVSFLQGILGNIESNINDWNRIVDELGESWADDAYEQMVLAKNNFVSTQNRVKEQIQQVITKIDLSAEQAKERVIKSTSRIGNNL